MKALQETYDDLTGDVLIVSAVISYLGTFTSACCSEDTSGWIKKCRVWEKGRCGKGRGVRCGRGEGRGHMCCHLRLLVSHTVMVCVRSDGVRSVGVRSDGVRSVGVRSVGMRSDGCM